MHSILNEVGTYLGEVLADFVILVQQQLLFQKTKVEQVSQIVLVLLARSQTNGHLL